MMPHRPRPDAPARPTMLLRAMPVLLLIAALSCEEQASPTAPAPAPAPAPAGGYRLVWADEFDRDGAPDPARWSYDVGGDGWGNDELQFYTGDRRGNARVEGGHLLIHRCRLIAQGPFEPGGGGLLEFRAPGSRPLKPEAGRPPAWPFEVAIDRNIDVHGVLVQPGRDRLYQLAAEVGAGVLPDITDTYPLKHAAEAHRRLEAGGVSGKLVITL